MDQRVTVPRSTFGSLVKRANREGVEMGEIVRIQDRVYKQLEELRQPDGTVLVIAPDGRRINLHLKPL